MGDHVAGANKQQTTPVESRPKQPINFTRRRTTNDLMTKKKKKREEAGKKAAEKMTEMQSE